VRCILVSEDGAADAAEKRPLAAVPADHFDGDIELRGFPDEMAGAADGTVMLSGATRLMRAGHAIGHLAGVEIDSGTGQIVSVVGKGHWWTPRVHLQAADLDFTVPGEIRMK
jgi:hypothetical protein